MVAHTPDIHTLDDLRVYVQRTLCEQNELEPDTFQITERILVRGDKPCGIYFCLHGPRSVKLISIWETERNTVLFYGSSGERCQRTQLTRQVALTQTA